MSFSYLKIKYLDETRQPMLSFLSLSRNTGGFVKCTVASSIRRVLHRLFINRLFLLFFKYTRQQQPYKIFNRGTSHGFVSQNFRKFF